TQCLVLVSCPIRPGTSELPFTESLYTPGSSHFLCARCRVTHHKFTLAFCECFYLLSGARECKWCSWRAPAGLGDSAARQCPTSADDDRTPSLRYRSTGTGMLPDTGLTGDRCPRREDGAPMEWRKDG
ncbi:hypothetical protein JG688_00015968, partial [Phytophthora aleatoria]